MNSPLEFLSNPSQVNTAGNKAGVERCVDMITVDTLFPEIFKLAYFKLMSHLYSIRGAGVLVGSPSRTTDLQHRPVHHDEADPFSDSHLGTLQHR